MEEEFEKLFAEYDPDNSLSSCPLCKSQIQAEYNSRIDGYDVVCPLCKKYEINGSTIGFSERPEYSGKLHILSGVIREANESGLDKIEVHNGNIDELLNSSCVPVSRQERMDIVLHWVEKRQSNFGVFANIVPRKDYPIGYVRDENEFRFYLHALVEKGLLEQNRNNDQYKVTFEGRNHIDEINRQLPGVLKDMLDKPTLRSNDKELDELLLDAQKKFKNSDWKIRKDGLDKLWKAFERLKTLEGGKDKAEQANNLIKKAIEEQEFRDFIEMEFHWLTDIGNNTNIRHSETNKFIIEKKEYVDHLFYRMFSLIHLIMKLTDRVV